MRHPIINCDFSGTVEELKEYMIANGPAAGLTRRWALPLKVPEFTGQITQIKNLENTKG